MVGDDDQLSYLRRSSDLVYLHRHTPTRSHPSSHLRSTTPESPGPPARSLEHRARSPAHLFTDDTSSAPLLRCYSVFYRLMTIFRCCCSCDDVARTFIPPMTIAPFPPKKERHIPLPFPSLSLLPSFFPLTFSYLLPRSGPLKPAKWSVSCPRGSGAKSQPT